MSDSKVLKSILLISALIAAGVGGAILFYPVAFFATNGIDIGGDISLLSETRAPGGALLAVGIVIALGAFVPSLTFFSIAISSLIYLAYGTSRILSMAIDGMPAEGIVMATALELAIGLVCVFALLKYRNTKKKLVA